MSSLFLVLVFVLSFLQLGSPDPNQHIQSFHVQSLLPNSICVPSKGSTSSAGQTVARVISRFGPCSPLANFTTKWSFTEQHQHDQARTKWIQSRILLDASQNQSSLPAHSGLPLGALEFIVSVGLGTPKQDFHVLFDTGSDVTWVQCEPCLTSCHPQQGPRFNPSSSTTFQYFPCNATQCSELMMEGNQAACDSSRCTYQIRYGDGSVHSTGFFGRDTLTLTSNDVFANFPFGCGTDQVGQFGPEAGLLGLGRNKLSLVSMTAKYYNSVFSYCLPTATSTGFLTFGADPDSGSAFFTPLLTSPRVPTFYVVSLLEISVGVKRLNVSSSLFSTQGMILDSGTSFTYLPNLTYAALKSAFNGYMSAYTLARGPGIFDTCYDFSGNTTVTIPQVTFHFEGGTNLPLDADAILAFTSMSQGCLAFGPSTGTGIIGSWQQQKTQIIYDLAQSRIGFKPKACS